MPGICVMGVGNVLMGDDGLGPYVIEQLQAGYDFSPEVTLFDAGTPGLDLTWYIDGVDALVVVDTVKAKGPSGEVRLYDRSVLLKGKLPTSTSPHDPTLKEALMRLDMLGRCPPHVLLIGVIPEKVETGAGLSDAVHSAIPHVLEQVVRTVRELGAKAASRAKPMRAQIWWEPVS